MHGLILYKRGLSALTKEDHAVNRFLEAGATLGITLSVHPPEAFEWVTTPTPTLFLNGDPIGLPDFLLPRIGAASSDYALALTQYFEWQGVRILNTTQSILAAKDKMQLSQLFMKHAIPHPNTMLLNRPVRYDLIDKYIGFPLIIKQVASARGVGVHMCENSESMRDLMGLFPPDVQQSLLVQSFVSTSFGKDLRVLVLNGRILGCMQRTAEHGFKANFSLGGQVTLFPLDESIEKLALICTEAVGLEFAGIDLLFGPEGYLVCEANSSPGFKGMELATGDDIATQVLQYVVDSL